MKLGKISLAAVVALGSLTTAGMAKDLSEAIKGVDVSGEIQYRYDNRVQEDKKTPEENHEFDVYVSFTAPVTDRASIFADVVYSQDNNVHPEDEISFHSEESQNSSYYLDQLYFSFAQGKTVANLGQQSIGSPFVDDMLMDGVKVLNSDIADWTFAAVYANNLEPDGDSTAMGLNASNGSGMDAQDLYVVAAIGKMGPVNLQGWYTMITNAVDGHIWLQADAKFDMIKVEAAYAKTLLDEDLDVANGGEEVLSDASYYALKVGAALDPVNLFAGYTYFEADEDGALSLVTIEGDGMVKGADFLLRSEYANKNSVITSENSLWYLGVDGKVMKDLSMGLAYSVLDTKDVREGSEFTLTGKYSCSKQMAIKPTYAYANIDPEASDDYTDAKFRVDVEYKF